MISFLKLIFIFLLLPATLISQPDDIQFEHLSVEDGLSNNSVHAILQDRKGFMWFGTIYGLNRWDGYEVKVFKQNPEDSTTLSNDEIYSLYEDSEGFIWVGTVLGLNKYDPQTEKFTRYITNNNSIDYILQNQIWQILEDESGFIWYCSSYGLCRLDKSTGKIKRFVPAPENPKTNFTPNYISSLCEIDDNRIMLGTSGGVFSFDTKNLEFKQLLYNDRLANWSVIHKVYKDRSGMFWIGQAARGLVKYDLAIDSLERYLPNPEVPFSINNFSISSIFENQNGILWIGGAGGGLNRFDRNKEKFFAFKHNSKDTKSICSSTIVSIYEDKTGNLWFGT
ncbi:MAG: hypothetical protein KJO12_07595, partial [Ignavibacteria bacterium]|nr:hypothetical protein [Ignavibacteria bacterium]